MALSDHEKSDINLMIIDASNMRDALERIQTRNPAIPRHLFAGAMADTRSLIKLLGMLLRADEALNGGEKG